MKTITWTTTQPTEITQSEMLIAVSDGHVRYYGTCPRGRTILGIGRAFARGFDHGESTDLVTATIERRIRGEWETMGRVTFGPRQPVRRA